MEVLLQLISEIYLETLFSVHCFFGSNIDVLGTFLSVVCGGNDSQSRSSSMLVHFIGKKAILQGCSILPNQLGLRQTQMYMTATNKENKDVMSDLNYILPTFGF